MIGRIGEPLDRGLADAALGHIDDPQQADGVCRVDQQPQIGQKIFDLTPVVEAQSSHNDVRDAPTHQRFLDRTGLGIGAIKHGHVTPAELGIGRFHRAQPVHHSLRLSDFVIAAGERDQFALTTRGAQHFVNPFAVVGNQRIGRFKDRGGGAVIFLQLHHGARGVIRRLVAEVVLKAHQDREIRSPEAVNALVGVTHHKHRTAGPVVDILRVLAIGHQQLDQLILGAVGVLILIHQNVTETTVPVAAHLLVLLEQLNR